MMRMGSPGVINLYPFILLLLVLTYTYPCFSSYFESNSHLCRPKERDALLRFLHSYNTTITWDEHVDCCQWSGISCDHVIGAVIGINMSNSALMGTINHIIYLSPLHGLLDLDLSHNHLHGEVPSELSHFSKLISLSLVANEKLTMESNSLKLLVQNITRLQHLNLHGVKVFGDSSNALVNISNALTTLCLYDCDLHGVFPESIFHLPNLLQLDVAMNEGLTVSLPTSNWSSPLTDLGISYTNFSGKLPDSVGNLKNLENLDISSCHISNSLPSSFGNLTRLHFLYLSSSFVLEYTIPSSICRLSSLVLLFLPHNNFNGMIPRCLGNLTNLMYLDLSDNQLIGPLPRSLANCSQLAYLNVSSNMVSDTITYLLEPLSELQVIDMASNSFHGEIPPFICRSTPSIVDLSYNKLTGTLPPCMINNTSHGDKILNFRMNKLEGTIPNTFPRLCSLVELDLSENRLTGTLPQSMVNCKSLRILELGHNNIEDFFPSWLETLPSLQILGLQFNKLHGEVKTLLNHHPFPNLRIFDIANNNFTGPLPTRYMAQLNAMKDTNVYEGSSIYLEVAHDLMGNAYSLSATCIMKGLFFNMSKVLNALKLIDFSSNHFHGEIPEIIGDLIALKGLNLSHNNLIGNIPPSFQNLTNLEWLDLSFNKLSGQIPSGLAHLTELARLDLSYNELRGMIPTGSQFDTFGKDSFEGNVGLCGSQIAVPCGELDIPQLPQLPSFQEDDFNFFDWKIILTGYGCGLVIGVSIGYIVFELQRPKWFVSLVEEKLLNKIVRPRRRANKMR